MCKSAFSLRCLCWFIHSVVNPLEMFFSVIRTVLLSRVLCFIEICNRFILQFYHKLLIKSYTRSHFFLSFVSYWEIINYKPCFSSTSLIIHEQKTKKILPKHWFGFLHRFLRTLDFSCISVRKDSPKYFFFFSTFDCDLRKLVNSAGKTPWKQ